jgi:hypothetical protein
MSASPVTATTHLRPIEDDKKEDRELMKKTTLLYSIISKIPGNTNKIVLSNGVSTSQFADAVANCGTDPLAREVYFPGKFEMMCFIAASTMKNKHEENHSAIVTEAFSGVFS